MSRQLSLQKNPVFLFVPVAVPEVGGHGGREEGSWTRGSLLRLEGPRAARPGAQWGQWEEGLPCPPPPTRAGDSPGAGPWLSLDTLVASPWGSDCERGFPFSVLREAILFLPRPEGKIIAAVQFYSVLI